MLIQNNKLDRAKNSKVLTNFRVSLEISSKLPEETAELFRDQLCKHPTFLEPQPRTNPGRANPVQSQQGDEHKGNLNLLGLCSDCQGAPYAGHLPSSPLRAGDSSPRPRRPQPRVQTAPPAPAERGQQLRTAPRPERRRSSAPDAQFPAGSASRRRCRRRPARRARRAAGRDGRDGPCGQRCPGPGPAARRCHRAAPGPRQDRAGGGSARRPRVAATPGRGGRSGARRERSERPPAGRGRDGAGPAARPDPRGSPRLPRPFPLVPAAPGGSAPGCGQLPPLRRAALTSARPRGAERSGAERGGRRAGPGPGAASPELAAPPPRPGPRREPVPPGRPWGGRGAGWRWGDSPSFPPLIGRSSQECSA